MNRKKLDPKKVCWGFLLLILISALAHSEVYGEWSAVTPPTVSSDWELFGVHLISSMEGWAVGEDYAKNRGVLLHFLNGTWTSVTPPAVSSDWGLRGVRFTSSGEGWAVGEDFLNRSGVLLQFAKGIWTSVTLPDVSSDWRLHGVRFVSSTEGWAVGKDSVSKRGVLLHFLSGSWTSVTPPEVSSDWELSNVHFTSSGNGWAVGKNSISKKGVLLHFSSGSWSLSSPPHISSNWELSSVHFFSPGEGWAVGNDLLGEEGTILHFSGGSWTPSAVPSISSDWLLEGIFFVSSGEGWAVGKDLSNKEGVILQFLSGEWKAFTPFPDVSSSDWGLGALHFTSADYGWAVGRDASNRRGSLLKYGVPHISVSPTKIDYHEVGTGAFLEKTVTVKNTGTADLIIGTILSSSSPFVIRTDDCSEKTLAPRLTCKVIYRFAPTSDGTFADSSTIPSNDPDKNEVVVNLSGIGVAGSPVSITLDAPDDEQEFTTCSLYAPPTFQWTPSEPFKSISLQFSLEDDFSTVPVKATGKAGINELLMKNSLWKKVLSLPGSEGGTAYWKVVGTRDDKTLVESDIFSIEVEEAAPVLDPAISHTSRTELPPPTLSWGNNCNVKFKAWFANDPDFMKRGVKKKALSFKVKNPNDNGGGLIEPLTPSQWQTIRKLVGDETGATLFWYVESWDGLKSYNQTAVMSFELTD